jgi:riboflavin kinase
MVLLGKVKSGMKSFSYWMTVLEPYYTKKTGVKLYPSTLNVELDKNYILPKDKCIRLEAWEYGGTVSVSILPCKVFGRAAFIMRTDKNASGQGDHPLNLIEVATDVRLRDVYHLSDGDTVEVEV